MSDTVTVRFENNSANKPQVNATVNVNDYEYTVNKTGDQFGDEYIATRVSFNGNGVSVVLQSPTQSYTLNPNGTPTQLPPNSNVARWGIIAKKA